MDTKPVLHDVVPAQKPLMVITVRRMRLLAAAALLILLVSLGYFLWYKPTRPTAVLGNSILKTLQLKSAQVALNGSPSTTDKLNASGDVVSTGALHIQGSYSNQAGQIQFEIVSVDGQDTYLKLHGLSALATILGSQAAQYGLSAQSNPFKTLDDKWLLVSKDTKNALLKNTQFGAGALDGSISSADKKAVAEAYRQHPFVKAITVLPDDSVQGQQTKHYQAAIDPAALTAFEQKINKTTPTIANAAQKMLTMYSSKSQSPFDIWTDKQTGYITQVIYGGADHSQSGKLSLSKYNQSPTIAKPTNATPLLDALGSVLLGGQTPQ